MQLAATGLLFGAAAIAATLGSCRASPCAPVCDALCGVDDGCGGQCRCPPGEVCSATGECRSEDSCNDTCADSSRGCGEVCGEACGCGPGSSCLADVCVCEPVCDGTHCRGDSCGGSCPCAAPNDLCDASGQCVSAAACTQTCAGAGASCGEICGESCGACDVGEHCVDGVCRCAPQCDGSHCGPDACGGSCASPCGSDPKDLSCAECSLQLQLLGKMVSASSLVRVDLAIELHPSGSEPGPRIMDLRLVANAQVFLIEATAGAALNAAGKSLWLNGDTGQPWRRLQDGSYQLLVLSNTDQRIGEGRLLELRLSLSEARPVAFALVKRADTFAPADADLFLQSTRYDGSVVAIP